MTTTTIRSRVRSIGLISLAGVFCIAWSQANRQVLTETAACGIQQALLKSPGHYVIAIVEHPGRFECTETSCVESLRIVKTFASRVPSGRHYLEPTIDVEASRDSPRPPKGLRSFVVAVPLAYTGEYYLPIIHGPVDEQDERGRCGGQACVRSAGQ